MWATRRVQGDDYDSTGMGKLSSREAPTLAGLIARPDLRHHEHCWLLVVGSEIMLSWPIACKRGGARTMPLNHERDEVDAQKVVAAG